MRLGVRKADDADDGTLFYFVNSRVRLRGIDSFKFSFVAPVARSLVVFMFTIFKCKNY